MSIPQTRADFKAFCLRVLGAPVLQINVDDGQVEDRIDQAFYMFNQYHMDATVKTFLKHEITPSIMHFTGTPTRAFQNNEVIIGATSNAHGQVVAPGALRDNANNITDANSISMFATNGPVAFLETGPSTSQAGDGKPFIDGEVVVGQQSGATATVGTDGLKVTMGAITGAYTVGETVTQATSGATGIINAINGASNQILYLTNVTGTFDNTHVVTGGTSGATATPTTIVTFVAIELGDMDNKFIPVPSSIIAITRIFPPFDSRISADILFDPQSQFNISLLSNFTSNSIIPYVVGRQYQQLLNDTFRGRPGIRFQRHEMKLYVDVNWFSTFQPHQFMIVECLRVIDPASAPDIYSDRWLQEYTTSLIKKQWGTNLKKFGQIALPGGVVLNGKEIYDEAVDEIKELEERLRTEYQLPIDFIVG